jgi:hypothetical protein
MGVVVLFLLWHSFYSTNASLALTLHCADSIYREDIVFKDPNLQFKGMKNYKIIFWSLRFHGRLFFKQIYVDVLRIWQPEDHQIKMRWRVHAAPRGWWQTAGTFDGISTYKLDNEGKIYEHMIDNVQLRDPPITNPLLYGLNYVLAPRLRPQQVPCPGSWGFTKHGNEYLVVGGPLIVSPFCISFCILSWHFVTCSA